MLAKDATRALTEKHQKRMMGEVAKLDLVVFKYSEEGLQTLEDGLYASGERLKEPAFAAKLARFVAASNRGWAWAEEADMSTTECQIILGGVQLRDETML